MEFEIVDFFSACPRDCNSCEDVDGVLTCEECSPRYWIEREVDCTGKTHHIGYTSRAGEMGI